MEKSPKERGEVVKRMAREVGFELVGVVAGGAEGLQTRHEREYREWLGGGKQGEMAYLERHLEKRLDIRKKYPWVRSIVCVGISYWGEGGQESGVRRQETEDGRQESGDRSQETEDRGQEAGGAGQKVVEGGQVGKIARYAWGRDYHKVVEGKLRKLEKRVREAFAGEKIEMRAYVDAGPLMEKELAARAGLGWVGKNTLLIHPRHGSWFVLGELVTSLELEPDAPVADHCGTCTRCIDACPTRAITPYSVDARACISYLTLEHRGEVPGEFHGALRRAGYLAGCDICQEVCPFNSAGRPLAAREADFAARPPAPAVPLAEVLAWSEQEWDKLTRGRAGRRAKYEMWRRNARVLSGGDRG